ncbi:MAG: 3-hydroxyacyl-ACP dehydratase [Gammaproteobacteria bacterium SG8_30]|jgi:3-hydroxyacyl-[acyl-carrier-protein] dehydratase|nr:MAG: 3-hydroxyacyl-ACP dehydratase [Gammaproteobacteria bacterium SG8_30]
MTEAFSMDVDAIMRQIPHRYPFLLVDRVTACVPGETIEAIKNVTVNEPFFPGHFPHRPVMPGVMILEALAQAAGILAFRTADVVPTEDTKFYFVGIDDARFRKPVFPGDQVVLKARLERAIRGIWKFSTSAEVDGQEVASATMLVAPGTGP